MADHFGAPGGGRSGAGESDPFAELTRIIGFDPRVRVHKPTAGAAAAVSSAPDADSQPAASRPIEADGAWEQEFESLDLDLEREEAPGADDASASTVRAVEQESIDVTFDDEEWQRAVAASLSALDAEPEETTAALRENMAVAAADARDQDAPHAAQAFDDEALLDAPLELGETDWDLASGEPVPDVPDDVPMDVEAVAAESLPAGSDDLAEAEDFIADIDLDQVLAASIERELEEAWTTQGVPEADESWAAAEPLALVEADEDAPSEPTGQPAAVAVSETDESLDFEDELAALLTEQDSRSADMQPVGAVGVEAFVAEPSADEPAERNPVDASPELEITRAGAPDALSPAAAVEGERPASSAPAEPERPGAGAPPESDDDPFAALAAMAARYRAGQGTSSWRRASPAAEPKSPEPSPSAAAANAFQEVEKGQAEAMKNDLSPRHHAPEIETVDVNEHAVAFTDDLDVPEMATESHPAARPAFDDLDTEFAELLNEMSEGGRGARAPAPAPQPSWQRQSAYEAYEARPARPADRDAFQAPAFEDEFDAAGDDGYGSDWQDDRDYAATDEGERDDTEFDPSDEPAPARGRKRGTWLAALFGSVAILGGVGAYALQNGGPAASGEPALIKADAGPLKVKPENPGGTQVPNQNNTVYERVAGATPAEPAQGQLMASSEEPVDLVARELEARAEQSEDEPLTDGLDALNSDAVDPDAVEAPKEEDRIAELAAEEPAEAEPAPVVVEPRKVRTMVVRSDGTLVPREEPAAEEPAPLVQPAVEAAAEALRQTQAGSMAQAAAAADRTASVTPEPVEPPAAAQPVPSADATPPAAEPVQMAALAPGSWSMQIASQPSEADAKSTYQDLARRYGSVLGGRPVSIVKAEISGKGTFWRVRIPADTRDDAVSMCSSYKAAGGNCFVSK